MPLPYLLFFVSGLAGLIYEVCWVRQFGNEFGNTVYSASLVAAVFMLGLGVGSRVGGAWADRVLARGEGTPKLLRAYGTAEIGIGAFGLLLAWLLPRLGGLSASVSSYVRGSDGWFELSFGSTALRYAIGVVLLAGPSLLMGATLTILIRAIVVRDLDKAGLRIGVLYAANTAGAALGAFTCDVVLVPARGIFGAQLVAVAANVLVGVAALAFAKRAPDAAPSSRTDADDAQEKSLSPSAKKRVLASSIALALSGFAALGLEIVWFRFLSTSLGAMRFVFSIVLGFILTGICLGALAGGICEKVYGRKAMLPLFVVSQALMAVTALGLLATFTADRTGDATAIVGHTFSTAFQVILLPSFLMGFSFPLVNAHAQDVLAVVGRRAGSMYLANTLGSVAGSLAAGLVLAPWVGSQKSLLVFAVCATLAPFAIVATERPMSRPLRLASTGAAIVSAVTFAAWLALSPHHLIERFAPVAFPREAILDIEEGPNEVVTIIDEGAQKAGGGGRRLLTNGHPMSSTWLPGQRYMRAFVHLPLLMTERPESALVICFGVGNTVHATSLHPSLGRIEIADLSRNVLKHASFFESDNHGVLRDPRVNVFVADGRQHLRQQAPDSYDLVTLEPPPLDFAGVSALYSREFYELVKTRLKPNGFMTQWLPAYQTTPAVGLAMVRAFVDVFPQSALLSGHMGELILVGTRRPQLAVDLDQLEKALAAPANERVAKDLRRVALGDLTQIVGMFLADATRLQRITADTAPMTDDQPLMEYVVGDARSAPRELFEPDDAGVARFCPKCFHDGAPDERVARLAEYMAALRDKSAAYPHGTAVGLDFYGAALDRTDFARAFTLAQQGKLEAAAKAFEKGLAKDPANVDARYNLAVVYASMDRTEDAVAQAEKVLAAQPAHVPSKKMLCALKGTHCP